MLPFSFYLELLIACAMLSIVVVMWRRGRTDDFAEDSGWWLIFSGFVLLLFGALVDISDHFPSLNRFIILGLNPAQSIAEKLVGFFGGFALLALGFVRWLPQIAERRRLEGHLRQMNLELEAKVHEGSQEIELSRLRSEIAQARHRRTANLLENMVAGASVALFATDTEGRVTHVAGRALESLAVDRSAVGSRLSRLLPTAEGPLALTLESGAATIAEVHHDGHSYQLRLAPLEDGEGAVVVASEVSELKQAQADLHLAKEAAEAANRAKSAFLATMSHELRTPLNSVIGFAGVLEKNRDGRLEATDLRYLGRIRDNGRHLLSLINDILDLSKIEAGRLELVKEATDLGELVDEVTKSLEPECQDGVALEVELPGGLEPFDTDPGRLRQILQNLVANAIKFTHEGTITISAGTSGPSGDGRGDGPPVWLRVTDSGIGIPPDRLGAVFEPFQQVDASTSRLYGGSGLGLSICRSLATAMGYSIRVDSVEGEGTEFTLCFDPDGGHLLGESLLSGRPEEYAAPSGAAAGDTGAQGTAKAVKAVLGPSQSPAARAYAPVSPAAAPDG
ncbi:MAG: ATP-binding protein, partial [Acidobacteriota bacterium]